MGVADNKSYKDMYHFNSTFFGKLQPGDTPSLKSEPKINTSISENPYMANVEIEKNELVVEPDLSAIYKARGKKHKDGGIDVYLKPESFVFSDFKKMKLSEDELKTFELKGKGGSTPAEIVKKNIDIEHYNKMMENISNPKLDDLAKRSSEKMISKYINTLGGIAYLQESKKGFPEELPAFAEGTAPVYDSELKDEIMSQKQYMQSGGRVGLLNKWYNQSRNLGYTGKKDIGEIQKFYAEKYPSLVTDMMRLPKMGQTNKGRALFGTKDQYTDQELLQGFQDNKLDRRVLDVMGVDRIVRPDDYGYEEDPKNPYVEPTTVQGPDGKTYYRSNDGNPFGPYYVFETGNTKQFDEGTNNGGGFTEEDYISPLKATPKQNTPAPAVPDVTGDPMNEIPVDWQFTPWQRRSQAYNLAKYAAAKRYMPMRNQVRARYMEPQLVNPEQAVGDMRAISNQQTAALSTLSPIMRNAQASSVYGQYLSSIPGIRTQYDNQNSQIVNQARQFNTQIANYMGATNTQYDAQYYRDSTIGRQNFDNMRQFLGDQYMNNVFSDVQTNQQLAYNMASQRQPAYRFDFKTGKFMRNPKSIMDVQSAGGLEELQGVMQVINQISDPAQKAQALTRLYGIRAFGPILAQPGNQVNPYGTF